ncbi:MAG: DNA polymerase IV [Nitriliruptorales bacterium]|nr:DNA polymerase IV [Nitriliruptorales bacterium]
MPHGNQEPDDAGRRDRPRVSEPILHADMDAFYASVEQRDDPSLQGRPVVVGGAGNRGVVAAASYEAREYGIRSAMPMVRARRQCPDLVVISGNFDKYRAASQAVMEIFRSYTPLVEPISLDEAFLDVGGSVRLFGTPVEIGHAIRRRVRDEVNLPCSVGVGPTKFAAKLLSAKAKPDGLLHVTGDELPAFLRPLPVGDLWGAGPRTVERLHSYGFRTVGQLADADRRTLERVVGAAVGSHLHALARGHDVRSVVPHEAAKSVSNEVTFDEDIDDPEQLARILLALSDKVGRRLRTAGLAGRTVTIKVRFASFETVTRSATLPAPTDRTHDLVDIATDLLDSLRLERVRVRLLGVGMSNLSDGATARQLSLDADPRWEDLDRATDAVVERFGRERIGWAALLDEEEAGFRWPTREDRAGD